MMILLVCVLSVSGAEAYPRRHSVGPGRRSPPHSHVSPSDPVRSLPPRGPILNKPDKTIPGESVPSSQPSGVSQPSRYDLPRPEAPQKGEGEEKCDCGLDEDGECNPCPPRHQ